MYIIVFILLLQLTEFSKWVIQWCGVFCCCLHACLSCTQKVRTVKFLLSSWHWMINKNVKKYLSALWSAMADDPFRMMMVIMLIVILLRLWVWLWGFSVHSSLIFNKRKEKWKPYYEWYKPEHHSSTYLKGLRKQIQVGQWLLPKVVIITGVGKLCTFDSCSSLQVQLTVKLEITDMLRSWVIFPDLEYKGSNEYSWHISSWEYCAVFTNTVSVTVILAMLTMLCSKHKKEDKLYWYSDSINWIVI